MIEQAYNKLDAAHQHLQEVNRGMTLAGVRDGDVGLWPSLWFEVRLEAEMEVLRATEQIKEAQKRVYI